MNPLPTLRPWLPIFLRVTRTTRDITRWGFLIRGRVKVCGIGPLAIFVPHGTLTIRP
jgi:hypothetical protein